MVYYDGLLAANDSSGEPFFRKLSKYVTSLYAVFVCQHRKIIRIHLKANARTAA